MKFISVTLRFSPEAKHFWRWLHTWLAFAAAGAPFAWDNISALQDNVPHAAVKWIQLVIVLGMVYNSTRQKKK